MTPRRDENGRFVKGASGNPNGRPPKKREERYYQITTNAVTFDQWQRIILKAAKQAERGDAQARKWLSEYLVGTPEQNLAGDIVFRVVRPSDKDA